MDQDRQVDEVDSLIDAAIAASVSVDPSPEFLARVRMKIASERASRGWGLGWLGVRGLAALVAVLLLVSVVRYGWRDRLDSIGPPAVIPTQASQNASVPLNPPRMPEKAVNATPTRSAIRTPSAEVIVSVGEIDAVRQFIADVQEGRFAFERIADGVPVSQELQLPPDIVVPELRRPPIGADELLE
jgi:hypothetical protein